jgi:hypothetical protein
VPRNDHVLVSGNGGILNFHSTLILEPPPIRLIAPLDRRRRRGASAIAALGDIAHAMPS